MEERKVNMKATEKFWEKLIRPLLNERGEVVIDGSGDEFTPEELAALGEDVEEETEEKTEEGETGEAEEKAEGEEQEAETKENLIPQSEFDRRFKEIRTQSEQKIDLLRTNPEEYYRKYPDEKPLMAAAAPKATDFESGKPAEAGKVEDLTIEGGTYDGWKFGDVFRHDPVTAYKISPYHARLIHDRQLDSEKEQRSSIERLKSDSEQEVISFSASIAKELFDKEDDLTPDQTRAVEAVLNKTLDWMGKTGRGGGILADSYMLMNSGAEKKRATANGAKAVINAANKGKVQTISSNASGGSLTGYEAIEAMSPDELANEIDSWPDKKTTDFLKKAPKSIRTKFPNLPWDYSL